MKKKKPMVLFALVGMFAFNTTNVYAYSAREEQMAVAMGNSLVQQMKRIVEVYQPQQMTMEQLYDDAMVGMTQSLDPYSEYFTAEEMNDMDAMLSGVTFGIGAVVIENIFGEPEILRIAKGSPSEKAGLQSGDVVTSISGKDMTLSSIDDVLLAITNSPNTFTMEVLRQGKYLTFNPTKEKLVLTSAYTEKIANVLPTTKGEIDKSVGYIVITQFSEQTAKEFQGAVKEIQDQKVKKLIIDLRNNGGGMMEAAEDIAQMLVPEGQIYATIDKSGEKTPVFSALKTKPFEKIVILTNERTASASELVAGAMQDAKAATLVGQTTFGKGIVQTVFPGANGSGIKLTTEEYITRNNTHIHDIGITPDVLVEPDAYTSPVIRLDRHGESPEVTQLKKALTSLGYETGGLAPTVDETTKRVVTQFQKDKELTVDGKLNFETIMAVNRAVYDKALKDDIVLKKAIEILK